MNFFNPALMLLLFYIIAYPYQKNISVPLVSKFLTVLPFHDLFDSGFRSTVNFQFNDNPRQLLSPRIKNKISEALAAFFFPLNPVLVPRRKIRQRYDTGKNF